MAEEITFVEGNLVASVEALVNTRRQCAEKLADIDRRLAELVAVLCLTPNPKKWVGPLSSTSRDRGVMPSSSIGRAISLLHSMKRPMHATEIVAALNATNGRRVEQATLVSGLSRYVNFKRNGLKRVGPNTFEFCEAGTPPSVDAVDPHAGSTGTPTTRE